MPEAWVASSGKRLLVDGATVASLDWVVLYERFLPLERERERLLSLGLLLEVTELAAFSD